MSSERSDDEDEIPIKKFKANNAVETDASSSNENSVDSTGDIATIEEFEKSTLMIPIVCMTVESKDQDEPIEVKAKHEIFPILESSPFYSTFEDLLLKIPGLSIVRFGHDSQQRRRVLIGRDYLIHWSKTQDLITYICAQRANSHEICFRTTTTDLCGLSLSDNLLFILEWAQNPTLLILSIINLATHEVKSRRISQDLSKDEEIDEDDLDEVKPPQFLRSPVDIGFSIQFLNNQYILNYNIETLSAQIVLDSDFEPISVQPGMKQQDPDILALRVLKVRTDEPEFDESLECQDQYDDFDPEWAEKYWNRKMWTMTSDGFVTATMDWEYREIIISLFVKNSKIPYLETRSRYDTQFNNEIPQLSHVKMFGDYIFVIITEADACDGTHADVLLVFDRFGDLIKECFDFPDEYCQISMDFGCDDCISLVTHHAFNVPMTFYFLRPYPKIPRSITQGHDIHFGFL